MENENPSTLFENTDNSILESTGLFELTRFTGDSADANFGWLNFFRDNFLPQRQDKMYSSSITTAFLRSIPFSRANGLMLDGIHLRDNIVNITPIIMDKLELALPILNNLGVKNITIGDSLLRIGVQGRKDWALFIENFKKGIKYKNPHS